MKKVAVALDWTPNTNHTGFYVSRAKGWFEEEGVDIELVSPSVDGYKRTPAQRVAAGEALLAIAPKETVLSYVTAPEAKRESHPPLVAVATILQENTSAIVTRKESGIDRPAKLDGKVYASYAARYEGRIVQQLIRNDGGRGEYTEQPHPMLDIWDRLGDGSFDAAWVFMGHEGVDAEMRGVDLNVFMLQDYGIPYGGGPVVLASAASLADGAQRELIRACMRAAARGFEYAAAHPDSAAEILVAEAAKDGTELSLEMTKRSQAYLNKFLLGPDGKFGTMQHDLFYSFAKFLSDTGMLTTHIQGRDTSKDGVTSLDGLRSGDVGEPIPLDSVPFKDLSVNWHEL
ncbi:unnamed protein product [Pedinophyceae sp. YPF-701]|nr:unnamed protein product [Pedinophyceae sp. YPF-701]